MRWSCSGERRTDWADVQNVLSAGVPGCCSDDQPSQGDGDGDGGTELARQHSQHCPRLSVTSASPVTAAPSGTVTRHTNREENNFIPLFT